MSDTEDERLVLVDASVFITLSKTGSISHLRHVRGEIKIPAAVTEEIRSEPAQSILQEIDWISRGGILQLPTPEAETARNQAKAHLGRDDTEAHWDGDLALLSLALLDRETYDREVVVITDDKPLRQTCKSLSIPVSGSIGVLINAVESDELSSDVAKNKLYAMDEVGARFSASLIRRAERLIDVAEDG